MSDDVRGNEPILTTKDAILELRGDMKTVLAWMEGTRATELPNRMDRAEDDISGLKSFRAWVLGGLAAATALGGASLILQILQGGSGG